MQLFLDVSITYKINKMGKNIGNPIPETKHTNWARNANIYEKGNIPPSVNISTKVGNNN